MKQIARSIRSFLGCRDFELSRSFYRDIGFNESSISKTMSYFHLDGGVGFYLQDSFVKDWIDNSMVFLEVDDPQAWYARLVDLQLDKKYPGVRVKPPVQLDWGQEMFLHDPVGILWHIGSFKS